MYVQEQLHGLEEQVSERDSEIEKLQEQLVQLTEDFRYNLKVYGVYVPRSLTDLIRCDEVIWHGCVHYMKDLCFRKVAAIWHLVCCLEFWSTCYSGYLFWASSWLMGNTTQCMKLQNHSQDLSCPSISACMH